LKILGYEVYDWELGRNQGQVNQDIDRLGVRSQKLFDPIGKSLLPVSAGALEV